MQRTKCKVHTLKKVARHISHMYNNILCTCAVICDNHLETTVCTLLVWVWLTHMIMRAGLTCICIRAEDVVALA